jgi:hypothetical protein
MPVEVSESVRVAGELISSADSARHRAMRLAYRVLLPVGMRYLALLAVVAIVYFVLARRAPVADVKEAMAQTEVQPLTRGPREVAPVPATSSIKRPLDRTHAVLDQVKARNGGGEF